MVGFHLGLRYLYNANQPTDKENIYSNDNLRPVRYVRPLKTPNIEVENPNSVNVFAAVGTVQTDSKAGTSERYTTFSGIGKYQHKFNNMHGITAGFNYFYDASLIETFPDNPSKRSMVGVHLGYDFMFYNFTIIGQLGTYLAKNHGKEPIFFRPGIRYDLGNRFYLQLALKADGFAADWVEFGIGFRPFKWY